MGNGSQDVLKGQEEADGVTLPVGDSEGEDVETMFGILDNGDTMGMTVEKDVIRHLIMVLGGHSLPIVVTKIVWKGRRRPLRYVLSSVSDGHENKGLFLMVSAMDAEAFGLVPVDKDGEGVVVKCYFRSRASPLDWVYVSHKVGCWEPPYTMPKLRKFAVAMQTSIKKSFGRSGRRRGIRERPSSLKNGLSGRKWIRA